MGAEKIITRLSRCLNWFIIIIMSIMVTITSAQVFCRYVLGSALSWPEEINVFLMAWLTFIGSAIALAEGSHMGVSFFVERLPSVWQKYIQIFGDFCVLIFLLAMTCYGWVVAIQFISVFSDDLEIPMVYPRISIFVGGVIMVFLICCHIVKDFQKLAIKRSGEN